MFDWYEQSILLSQLECNISQMLAIVGLYLYYHKASKILQMFSD